MDVILGLNDIGNLTAGSAFRTHTTQRDENALPAGSLLTTVYYQRNALCSRLPLGRG